MTNLLGSQVQHIHCIGVGGVGMSGVAQVLYRLGYQVSGSDLRQNMSIARLKQLGVKVFVGHAPEHVGQADLVVVSTAVPQDNPELQMAITQGVTVVSRAQMLAELMRQHSSIAVTGTHGKTTTTSLMTQMFLAGGLDPSFVIGGKLNCVGTNARLGQGPYFIAEADESDASFLLMRPNIAVITNIDHDHMVTYDYDEQRLKQAFVDFLQCLPCDGLAVMCQDDALTASITAQAPCRVVTYGAAKQADVRLLSYQQCALMSHFVIEAPCYGVTQQSCQLNALGYYNALNALAGIAVALECGVAMVDIISAMENFAGIGRRCQHYGDVDWHGKKITLLDDYGHHPKEIALTYQAVKAAYDGRRVVLVYQPHRYTRTQELFDDFVDALSRTDALVLIAVYAAGEMPITGADSQALCRAIEQQGQVIPRYVSQVSEIAACLESTLQDGDVLLTQGAGDIGQFIPHWKQSLANQTDEVPA
jgi:UDP-N-acetylmuramate--alanine ligase